MTSPASPLPAGSSEPEHSFPSEEMSPSLLQRFFRAYRKASGSSIVLSALIHGAILVAGVFFIVSQVVEDRKISFGGGQPGPKAEIRHKVQMKRKTTSSPLATKRVTTTNSLATVALPDMPDIPTGMGPSAAGAMGAGGFALSSGLGGGGGNGGKFSNVNFFGLRTKAQRIAFLLDYSGTMDGEFRASMEKELERALKALPSGTRVLLIPWAGPAWLSSETAPQIMSKWKKLDFYDNFSVVGGAKLTPPTWIETNPDSIGKLMKDMRAQVAAPGGTDWRQPFRYVMEVNPSPEVIFFMTDGQLPPDRQGRALDAIDTALRRGSRAPQVNCLWIQNSEFHGDLLRKIATKYKGEYRAISASSSAPR